MFIHIFVHIISLNVGYIKFKTKKLHIIDYEIRILLNIQEIIIPNIMIEESARRVEKNDKKKNGSEAIIFKLNMK